VGLDVHKQLIAFCVKTADGEIVAEGTIAATRAALNEWKHKRGQTHLR
jgi:transposase